MAQPATVKAQPTHVLDVPGHGKQTLPLLGPYGDKSLHGSKLLYHLRQSETAKRKGKQDETLARVLHIEGTDYWAVCCWSNANAEEVKRFANAKPEVVGVLMDEALEAQAGYQSWKEQRGGATTVWCSLNGAPAMRVPVTAYDAMKAAGLNVVRKEKPVKA